MRTVKKKWFRIASSAVLALVIIASITFGLSSRVSVSASKGIVSIALVSGQSGTLDTTLLASLLPLGTDITVKFEPSGTHIKNDYLLIRLDVYIGSGSKTYPQQYVSHYVRELTQEELDNPALAALVPTYKALNPAICMFFKVKPNMTAVDLGAYLGSKFNRTLLSNLDYILAQPKTDSSLLKLALFDKMGTGLPGAYGASVVDEINKRFAGLEIKL